MTRDPWLHILIFPDYNFCSNWLPICSWCADVDGRMFNSLKKIKLFRKVLAKLVGVFKAFLLIPLYNLSASQLSVVSTAVWGSARGYIPMVGAGSFNQHLAPCFTNSALPPPIFCWSLSQCSAPPAPPSVMLTRGYTEREELDKLFTCYFICIQCISYWLTTLKKAKAIMK